MISIKNNIKRLIGRSLDEYTRRFIKPLDTRIDNLVAQAGNSNSEIVDGRIDSSGVTHTTIGKRITAETKIMDKHLVDVTGKYISVDGTVKGSVNNIEILGETIQNPEDLSDIKSVGILQEDGNYKMSILSCSKNLFDGEFNRGYYINATNGNIETTSNTDAVSGFIKVKPNSNYIISYETNRTTLIGEYKSDMSFIKRNANSRTVTTSSDTHYIRFQSTFTIKDETQQIQLEEGTVATPYVPHMENKSSILMPTQLEKWDRLYFDKEENAWVISKGTITENIEKYISSAMVNINDTLDGLAINNSRVDIDLGNNIDNIILEGKKWNDRSTTLTVNNVYSNTSNHIVCFAKGTTLEQAKDFLIGKKVKYKLKTPTKIILPKSTQIQLNSFADKTHIYTTDTEIEPTIKAKVSKSIGASIESIHNKTDILEGRVADIEGLKSSQDMKYQTDKGYLVCNETMDGVVKDIKVKGKTLVSKYNLKTHTKNCTSLYDWIKTLDYTLTQGKTYTLKFNLKTPSKAEVQLKYAESNTYITNIKNDFLYSFTATKNEKLVLVCVETGEHVISDLMILEGDHTQNPPQGYFEGLMSVGEDVNEIEVSSRKEDGNLFDGELELGKILSSTGLNYTDTNNIRSKNKTFLTKGDYVLNGKPPKAGNLFKYDKNGNYIGWGNIISSTGAFTVDVDCYVRFQVVETNTLDYKIAINKVGVNDINLKQDKKAILYYNQQGELVPLTELHEWDEVNDTAKKYYKRSGKRVLNGSEDWIIGNSEGTHIRFTVPLLIDKVATVINKCNLICDKLKTKLTDGNWVLDEEYIGEVDTSNKSRIIISISKSKLETQDVSGFKKWLQTNNVTVVYKLAEEEVYDIVPLNVDAYSNETMISVNCGAINPHMEFSITSYITNLIQSNKERIKALEGEVYKYIVTQNRLQLASIHSTDSVTFRVDIATYGTMSNDVDYDKYKLILDNITVGKDNYNRAEMEGVINDYFMWFILDFDMYTSLLELIEQQHASIQEIEVC